jgi:hypothetical protein
MQVIAADMHVCFTAAAFLFAIGIDVHPGALDGHTPVIASVGVGGDDHARLDAKGIHGAYRRNNQICGLGSFLAPSKQASGGLCP